MYRTTRWFSLHDSHFYVDWSVLFHPLSRFLLGMDGVGDLRPLHYDHCERPLDLLHGVLHVEWNTKICIVGPFDFVKLDSRWWNINSAMASQLHVAFEAVSSLLCHLSDIWAFTNPSLNRSPLKWHVLSVFLSFVCAGSYLILIVPWFFRQRILQRNPSRFLTRCSLLVFIVLLFCSTIPSEMSQEDLCRVNGCSNVLLPTYRRLYSPHFPHVISTLQCSSQFH